MRMVSGRENFLEQYNKLQGSSRAFVFFLFDSRPSQNAVQNALHAYHKWLDEISRATGIFCFLFMYPEYPEYEARKEVVVNPSPEIADLFGVTVDQLPGILIFTTLKERGEVNKGIYLPLKPDAFASDYLDFEKLVADVFSLIQQVQRATPASEDLLDALASSMGRMRLREKTRPIKRSLRAGLITLSKIPKDLVKSVLDALSTEMARRVGGP